MVFGPHDHIKIISPSNELTGTSIGVHCRPDTSPSKIQILPKFAPTLRNAVLINGRDIPHRDITELSQAVSACIGIPVGDPRDIGWSIATGTSTGASRVFEMQCLLTGKIESPELNAMLSDIDNEARCEEILNENLESRYSYAVLGKRKELGLLCENTIAYLTPSPDIKLDLALSIEELKQVSSSSTLSLFFITTHGNPGELCFNGQSISHDSLIANIGEIPGKKVIICLACYSGGIIDSIKNHPQASDFIAITSTNGDQKSLTYLETKIFDQLVAQCCDRKSVVDMRFKTYSSSMGEQTPQVFLGDFDVVV